jgi:hypothetical protein
MDKKIRLTSIQKTLLDTIVKLKLLENVDIPLELNINLIDTKDLKKYNDIHSNINEILTDNKIEPHEIFNMIETYKGNHPIYNKFKNLIIIRNTCILKKIKENDKWNTHIQKIMDILKKKYKHSNDKTMFNIIENIIMDILIKDIKMFDILQCKITLDSNNNIKNINISNLDDQKYIISKLLENGCVKI